jgi:hypothetical protein
MTDEPLLDELTKILSAVRFGDVEVTFQRHEGKTASLVINAAQKHRFETTEAALRFILEAIKVDRDKRFSGTRSFSVVFNQGEVTRVVQQGYERLTST